MLLTTTVYVKRKTVITQISVVFVSNIFFTQNQNQSPYLGVTEKYNRNVYVITMVRLRSINNRQL